MTSLRRAAATCGVASPALAVLGIGLAILRAPGWSFARDALSDLGVTPGAAPFFNLGVAAAGVVGLGFAWFLWTDAAEALQRAGAAATAVSLAGLVGVGAFPSGEALHAPAALTFYAGFTYALFLWGSGDVLAGAPRRGLRAVWLAVAHVTAWLVWGLALLPLGVTGVAVPETAGALVFVLWAVTTARRARRRGP